MSVHPYSSLAYARTLGHVGQPFEVPEWKTYVIQRACSSDGKDATGPYPITCLAPDADIQEGLARLRRAGLISVTLVTDDLVGPPRETLFDAFPYARDFKTHYLVDQAAAAYRPSSHHRYEIRRAARHGFEIGIVNLTDILPAWTALYEGLIERHRITGVQRFTGESFSALSKCDGLTAVAGFVRQELVACHLWFAHDGFAWSHLGASSEIALEHGGSYAIYDYSIRHFASHVINLGGSAGPTDRYDGLSRFKEGFANRVHSALLCGAVLDEEKYAALSGPAGASSYFPAYRAARGSVG